MYRNILEVPVEEKWSSQSSNPERWMRWWSKENSANQTKIRICIEKIGKKTETCNVWRPISTAKVKKFVKSSITLVPKVKNSSIQSKIRACIEKIRQIVDYTGP